MKKQITTILLALVSLTASAQFKTVPNGMVTTDDKEFMVVEIEGTQAELFHKCKTTLTGLFKSAQDALSMSEPDIITINGKTSRYMFTAIKMMGHEYTYGLDYVIRIQFRDGRMRIDTPQIDLVTPPGSNFIFSLKCGSRTSGAVYDKNCKPRWERVPQDIDGYINSLVNDIINGMKNGGSTTQEDW